jgi:hypothetical protein
MDARILHEAEERPRDILSVLCPLCDAALACQVHNEDSRLVFHSVWHYHPYFGIMCDLCFSLYSHEYLTVKKQPRNIIDVQCFSCAGEIAFQVFTHPAGGVIFDFGKWSGWSYDPEYGFLCARCMEKYEVLGAEQHEKIL